MEAYTAFAEIYDEMMDEIPYDKWLENITGILHENDIKTGLVAELGCGTGIMTRALANKGYDMIGIDLSDDMLAIAREQSQEGILYLMQDMRELELYGTVNAFVSICDSMNYLMSISELTHVLKKVNLYLEKDGIFIFDIKTKYLYETILGDTVQCDNREDVSIIWENHYDKDNEVHIYDLTMFIGYDSEDGELLFEKYNETHYQKVYNIDEVCTAIRMAGMELLKVCDASTLGDVQETSERVYFVVREGYQTEKYYGEKENE